MEEDTLSSVGSDDIFEDEEYFDTENYLVRVYKKQGFQEGVSAMHEISFQDGFAEQFRKGLIKGYAQGNKEANAFLIQHR